MSSMTMSEARTKYKLGGGHFFDRDTMEFFGSRIESSLYQNRCFVTSENDFFGENRFYTVRRFTPDYKDVETIGKFNSITSKAEAVAAAKAI